MSSKPAWIPVYFDDWLGDTQDLSLIEHGAYFRLMCAYYANGGWLPADKRRLYRVCGALEAEEQQAIDMIVSRYFDGDRGDYLSHRRADRELEKIAEKSRQAKAAAERRHANAPAGGDADAPASAHADGGATRARGPHPTSHTPEDQNNPEDPDPQNPDERSKQQGAHETSAPAQGGNGRSKPRTANRFDEFWQLYPSRRGKKRAREIWLQKNLDERADEILHDVRERQKHDQRWLGGYVPNPTTYLNQERWEDEFGAPAKESGADGNLAVAERWAASRSTQVGGGNG